MPEIFDGFLEVRNSDNAIIQTATQKYNLGFVKSIYSTHEKYIVWFDDEDCLWYEIDKDKLTLDEAFHKFWNKYEKVASESHHNLNSDQKVTAKDMRASALSSALEGKYESADLGVADAANYIKSINERVSKKRYLIGVIGAASLACIFALIAYWIYFYLPVDKSFQILGAALGGGAIGTVLSATTGKIEDARFDPNATAREGYLNGALRVLYGLCGSLVIVIAFKSGLIDSKLISAADERYFMFLLGVAGGFIERFSANILSGLSSNPKT